MTRSSRPQPRPRARAKPHIGIRLKILFAIMAIVVAVIATVWVLQVVLLDHFYRQTKQEHLLEIIREVGGSIDQNGFLESGALMSRLASENSICVDVGFPGSKLDYLKAEGIGDNCYVHGNLKKRAEIVRETYRSSGGYLVRTISHDEFDTSYMVCAVAAVTSDQTPYTIIVTTSLAPLRDVTAVIQEQLLFISPLLVVAATLIAFLCARSITRPLDKISKAARRIADGSLGVKVDVRSNDEIGDLARDFNTMSREISKVNTLQRELVANISHDIRTPLTMIKGYAEMIKDITGDDREAREQQLDIIVDEANRLSTLVSDVMELSLMQAGQTAFHPADFDITAKARDILSRYQLLEQTRGFEFRLEADRAYLVHADEVRIEQVVYNLVNNAVNHIGEMKRITVRVTAELPETGEVKVEVIDTGTGIRQEDLPLIWDRYYKPYKKGEKQTMGTGLGLSIVKAILVNHHSRFGVNSTLGVGSAFWFTLRLAEGETKLLSSGEE